MGRKNNNPQEKYLTVGELKEFLKNVPDDAIVVVPGSDHSYDALSKRGGLHVAQAEYIARDGYFGEYYGDGEDESLVVVLVVSGC